MHHHVYGQNTKYKIAILVQQIRVDEIQKTYLTPYSVEPEDVLVLDLHASKQAKNTPVKEIKEYIEQMLYPAMEDAGVEYIVCSDPAYFKVLAGVTKVDANIGYVLDSIIPDMKVIYVPSYRRLFYDPEKIGTQIKQGMEALTSYMKGGYTPPGTGIIHQAHYPKTVEDISCWLNKLLEMDVPLTCDIETFSLKHYDSGIATISFAWNQHEGIAFAVDYASVTGSEFHGEQVPNLPVRILLKEFFTKFKQRMTFHKVTFDATVLIYNLFMNSLVDSSGLAQGLDIMSKYLDCSLIITYLATNSCAGNALSLKEQAQEFAGNYAKTDINDVRKIPLEELLEYNLVDTLSTWYVLKKHYPTMVNDQQKPVYEELFLPGLFDIIETQLTGMPVSMGRVKEVKSILTSDYYHAQARIEASPLVQEFTYLLKEKWVHEKNQKLKVKRVTIADAKESFNPGSGQQLQALLFDFLKLPVLDYTDSKQPATDKATLKALRSHTKNQAVIDLLNALLDISAVGKILNSFIPALEKAQLAADGWHYLFGNFNLGGTVSGRLSSNDPKIWASR